VQITEHTVTTGTHTTSYLAAGPEDGPLVIFVHGWPELSLSWRHQLPALAALGFRAVAPDLRGYGRSSVYQRHEDYAQSLIVGDMLDLLSALGRQRAVWVGHDWGCPTVWNIASHHPENCDAVANLCVPYYTLERGVDACVNEVNRDVYGPRFPAGQWEYQLFYQENFAHAREEMEAHPFNTVKLLFRSGDPLGDGQPATTAMTRINGGWFGPAAEAPDVPRDAGVVSEDELAIYAEALSRNGFFGPNSYYMNHDANETYANQAANSGYLDMPVLFLGARYDYVCECFNSTLAEPMRLHCGNLNEVTVYSGHWMAQERPADVNAALVRWLATEVAGTWPTPRGHAHSNQRIDNT
jgi:pimeloyl-ACP methyl ester carboxylesterase